MSLSRVIPSAHHALVMQLRSETNPDTGAVWTSRDVAAHLAAKHGIAVSHRAVLRLEAALSKKGDALLVQALREEFLDAVGPMKARLVKASKTLARRIAKEADTAKVASGVRALSGVVDSLAKLGGVAAPIAIDVTTGGQPLPDAYALLAAAAARLAEEPAAAGPDEADPRPPA